MSTSFETIEDISFGEYPADNSISRRYKSSERSGLVYFENFGDRPDLLSSLVISDDSTGENIGAISAESATEALSLLKFDDEVLAWAVRIALEGMTLQDLNIELGYN